MSVALKKLTAADKELIVYRYFENRIYSEIAKLLFIDIATVRRKLDNIILEVGRRVYGMEQEFWDTIHRENYYKELEKIIYNRIVKEIKTKVLEEFVIMELS